VLFNSILCRANLDLAAIAEILGEDPSEALAWHRKTSDAINAQLWDEEDGLYYEYDRVAGRLLKDNTIAGFHTLFGGVATPERAKRMIEQHMLNAGEFWPDGGYPLPTTAMNSPWFNAENYWLGPVWINTNWMVLRGLPDYGRSDLASTMRQKTLELVANGGYREYFNPYTGEGYGTDSFSWTSALTIDLVESG
jgi:neutral trehalase